MSKKLTKFEKRLLKEWMDIQNEISSLLEVFYPDGISAPFKFPAINGDAFDDLYNWKKALTKEVSEENQRRVQESDKQEYVEIHQKAQERRVGYIEVCLDKGIVHSADGEYNLADSIAMIEGYDDKRVYVFFKAEDKVDAKIIIGGTDAYLVLGAREGDKDSEEDIILIDLDRFHLIGICDNAKPGEEDGVMVSFYAGEKEAICYHMENFELGPLGDLLLGGLLRDKWTEAKEEQEKRLEEVKGETQKC